jgi:hypothetical protein
MPKESSLWIVPQEDKNWVQRKFKHIRPVSNLYVIPYLQDKSEYGDKLA